MGKNNSSRDLGAKTAEDFEKLAQLRKMQAIALWLLVFMAVVFAVSFSLQDTAPAWGFVRAASEGGMVGAIADWFAVTALFRHPLGIKIPHTNLIARKKDDIGEGLGSFIEENFLSDEVVHDKLSTISGARHAGEWLSNGANAQKVSSIAAEILLAAIQVLDDQDVQELIEDIAKKHIFEPEWSANIGRALDSVLTGNHAEVTIDILADHLEQWLTKNPESFERLVSGRLPAWLPGTWSRFLDKKAHSEALKFIGNVKRDAAHPLRAAAEKMLHDLAHDLQHDEALQKRVENLKLEIFSSPRVRLITQALWNKTHSALLVMLKDPKSELRVRLTKALVDLGTRLAEDTTLQYKVDVWVITAAEHLVRNYRHDLASIITETVRGWDASEAAQKIELQIGKDLQFIRINGTVVGSLAGVTIYTLAVLGRSLFT